ncbi:uncharacterized protein LOC142973820 [Anticarsia gemmatalis]|uniref:uncharacterized protein LOC142973820 n=1 Tax=Anticarsia gemmatalis TaxID=129554 RepID=UPI003F75EB30
MFFVFHILIIINYVSNSNNFVLKRLNHGVARDTKQKENHMIWQDVQNNKRKSTTLTSLFETKSILSNTSSPNLKVNMFDKRLSDEMLSIRQNIFGRDVSHISTRFQSTKNNIEPTLEIKVKQKWPLVELLANQDEAIDDFDFRHLLSEENYNMSVDTNVPIKEGQEQVRDNQTKNKIVDLRSLANPAPVDISNQRQGDGNNLVNDLIDDLSMLYPGSVIRNCYCSSSSHGI